MTPGPRATQDFQGQMDVFAHPGLESALSGMASEPSIHLCLPHSILLFVALPLASRPKCVHWPLPFYHRLHLHVTGSLHEETMSPQTSYTYFQCCLRKTNSNTGRE